MVRAHNSKPLRPREGEMKYRKGDEVEVTTRAFASVLLGRYTLVEKGSTRGPSWQAKHHRRVRACDREGDGACEEVETAAPVGQGDGVTR